MRYIKIITTTPNNLQCILWKRKFFGSKLGQCSNTHCIHIEISMRVPAHNTQIHDFWLCWLQFVGSHTVRVILHAGKQATAQSQFVMNSTDNRRGNKTAQHIYNFEKKKKPYTCTFDRIPNSMCVSVYCILMINAIKRSCIRLCVCSFFVLSSLALAIWTAQF